MPVFEVELSDGTMVDIEAERQPTPEEAQEIISKTPRVGRAEAFGIGAAKGILPGAAFAATVPFGAEAGAALGSFGGPVGTAVGGIIGGLAVGGGAAGLTALGQESLLKKLLPADMYAKISEHTAAAQAQHPGFSVAGEIAGMAPTMEIAPFKLAQIPIRAAVGGTIGAVQPLVTGRLPTKEDVLAGAAATTLYGRSRFEGLPSLAKKGISYARGIEEAAKVHGDVRAQPVPSVREVPTQEGGPGVQPRPEEVAQGAQVPLTPEWIASEKAKEAKVARTPEQIALDDLESQRYEEAERAAIAEAEKSGMKATVVEAPPAEGGAEVPWAAGQFMRPTAEGGVEINRPAFRSWVRNTLSKLPPEQQAQAIAARIDEEMRHGQIISALGGLGKSNTAMSQFWNDLTGLEKRLEYRSYTGAWTPDELAKTWGREGLPSDSDMGHEVVRRRTQKLAGMTPSEVAETVGMERWTVKSINAMSDMIYNARAALGTKASARQRATWDKIQLNLEVARKAATAAGAAPAARERRPEEGIQAIRPAVRLINGDIKVGEKGEVHNDIMERHKLKGVDVDRRGFMGPQGWIDREQGPDSGREVPGMHATELAKMQEAAPAAMMRELAAGDPDGDQTAKSAWARHYLQLFHTDPQFKHAVLVFNSELSKAQGSAKPKLTINEIGKIIKDVIGPKYYLSHARQADVIPEVRKAGEEMGAAYIRATEEQAMPGARERDYKRFSENYEGVSDRIVSIYSRLLDRVNAYNESHNKDEWIPVDVANLPSHSYPESYFEFIKDLPEPFRKMAEQIRTLVKAQKSLEKDPRFRTYSQLNREGAGEGLPVGPGPGLGPAARQRKKPSEREQAKMPFESEYAFGPPKEDVGERVGAVQAGALPANKLAALRPGDPPGAVDIAIASERPSFHDFVTWVQRNVAGYSAVNEPQLRELWEDKVWSHLVSAPGARIEQLLKSLQLESRINPALRKMAGVRGVPQPRRIPDEYTAEMDKQRRLATAAAAYLGEQPDLVRLEQDRKQIELGQRLRRHAITEIGMKLLRESMPELGLHRTEITLEDIDFEHAGKNVKVYQRFSEREGTDPDYYTKALSDRARPNKWSALTKTRRLAVLVNKDTGAVELVGAYQHGRQGIEIVDPTGATGVRGKEHFALSNYLGRYRLHATILLRDPVQFFHQHFDKLSEYANKIEDIALQREKVAELEEAGESVEERKFMSELFPGEEAEVPEGLEPVEEEPPGKLAPARAEELADVRAAEAPPAVGEVKGEGGMLMGPEAKAARGMMGIGKGFTRGRELMSSEANAFREFVTGVVGKVESEQDFTDAVNELIAMGKLEAERRPRKITGKATGKELVKEALTEPIYRFTGQYRKAVDAIRKAAHLILVENHLKNRGLKPEEQVHMTDAQAYDRALDHFYEAITTTENPADYTQKALGRFAKLVRQDLPAAGIVVPGAAEAQARGVQRELTMRQRVPPTVVRGPEGKPILGTQPAPGLPQGRPGAVVPPEMLPGGAAPVGAKAGPPAELGQPIMEQAKPTGKGLYYPRLKPLKREGGVPFYSTQAATPQPLPQELKQAWLGALGQEGRGRKPGAFDRAKAQAVIKRSWVDFEDKLKAFIPDLKAISSRAFTMHDLFAYKQGAANIADNQARQLGEMIRLATFEGEARTRAARKKADMVDRSIAAVLAARVKDKEGNLVVNQQVFDNFLLPDVEVGRLKGLALMKSSNPRERLYGRKVVDMAAEYKAEIEYARDHWGDADMQAAVYAFEQAAEAHRQAMNAAGFQLAAKENWFPGRYQGEMWMDNTITFAPNKILGTNFGRPKTFDNKYRAFANPSVLFQRVRGQPGQPPLIPYIAVNNRASDLLQHSIARGLHLANDQQWMEWLRTQKDPASGKPIAVKPKLIKGMVEGEDPDTGEIVVKETLVPKPPSPDYVIIRSTPNGPAMAIREGYKRAVGMALAPSRIEEFPVLKEAHRVASMLKHGLILMLDTFHVGRLGQYSLALGAKDWGKSFGFKNGLSALTWSEADLPEAMSKGLVSKDNVDWALEKLPVYTADGYVKRTETRHARIQEAMRRGLNSATSADTLYRNAIQSLPFVGEAWSKVLSPANKWIFDKITPGMIAEAFSNNFERLHKANPKIPYDALMRDVIRDTNVFYGNLGRQGFFRNATFRDLASIIILAPLWREGLIRKEAMFWSRASGLSYLMGRRGMGFNAYMGTLGRGVAMGLGAWFAIAQAINLMSKGHFTWQNDEEGHALDAWIPTGKGGIWISTLGVFAELSHDLIRLGETKPKVWDAITQMGANSMGPMGRMAHILTSGQSPTGQQYTTTGGVIGGALGELAPTPISLATPLRAIGYGQPLRPGEALQRGLATLTGTKSTIATRPSQDVQQLAEKWLRHEGLKYEPMAFTPTDQASYAKLRGAVRNDDTKGAKKILEELRKHRTDSQIMHALKVFSRHPFTGTLQHERMFLYSLSDKELELYNAATMERFETYSKAADLILSQ